MLRLVSTQGFLKLWKCSRFVESHVTKINASFLPVCTAWYSRTYNIARRYNTGIPLWKDAPRPKNDASDEVQTVDLDKWKSVMRSRVASAEKEHANDEEESGDDEDLLQTSVVKDSSLLEATRDLVTMWRQAGKLVPEEMTDEEVKLLADLTTKSSKKKYLKYLAVKEGHKKTRKEKQQKKKAEKEASVEQNLGQDVSAEERDNQKGAEPKNTFLLQFWSRSLDKLLAWRSAQSMVFDQPLVFDMSYESNMSRREMENTVSQLMEVEGWNRRAAEPFHLHYCNLQPDGAYKQELLKRYGAEAWNNLLITATDRQHVDVFPREKLVYLTADSPNVLRTFDHSKVYIIGALVDRSIQSGLSLSNAKRLKLTTARLPLDEFLHWEIGAKNLTLDQMIRIMITLKESGKWEEALKFVPKRKHDGFLQQRTRREITNDSVRGVANYGSRKDDGRRLRYDERTFKNKGQSLYRSQSGSTGRDLMAGLPGDREKPAETRVRTSFQNSMRIRKGAGKSKMWWDDE